MVADHLGQDEGWLVVFDPQYGDWDAKLRHEDVMRDGKTLHVFFCWPRKVHKKGRTFALRHWFRAGSAPPYRFDPHFGTPPQRDFMRKYTTLGGGLSSSPGVVDFKMNTKQGKQMKTKGSLMKRILKFIGCLALGCVGLTTLADPVAKIGDVAYEDFATAWADLQKNGGEMTLFADVEAASDVSFSKPTVLDLNGKTLQFGKGTNRNSPCVNYASNCTIKNGTIKGNTTTNTRLDDYNMTMFHFSGSMNLTLQNVTLKYFMYGIQTSCSGIINIIDTKIIPLSNSGEDGLAPSKVGACINVNNKNTKVTISGDSLLKSGTMSDQSYPIKNGRLDGGAIDVTIYGGTFLSNTNPWAGAANYLAFGATFDATTGKVLPAPEVVVPEVTVAEVKETVEPKEGSETLTDAEKTEVAEKTVALLSNEEVAKAENTGIRAAAVDKDDATKTDSLVVAALKAAVDSTEITDKTAAKKEVETTTVISFLEIKPIKTEVNKAGDTVACTLLAFDVTPKVKAQVAGQTVIEATIPNDAITEPITVRIPVTDDFTEYAKVTHRGDQDEVFYLPVQGEPGKLFVEFTATKFSEYDAEPVLKSAVPVAKIGSNMFDTLAAALAAAQNDDVVEMQMPCELTETLTIDKSITLKTKDLVVAATAGAGLALADGAQVTLDITGDDNAFTGAAGFAGINVPVGTELTITGTGKMVANGGANGLKEGKVYGYGAGAGIGGNGDLFHQEDGAYFFNDALSADFGVIKFAENAAVCVQALGGRQTSDKSGGGAGIGGGGTAQRMADDDDYPAPKTPLQGAILINGGVIDAQGGNSDGYLGCGGAGIGGGGSANGTVSAIAVTINDGTVTANGGTCGAGIGGGGGCDGGTICLMGGKITAAGKVWGDGDTSGGAGIGGGDGAGASSIVIGGTADVEAVGSGVAAGIGSGTWCDVAEIIIKDDAKVKAVGGSYGSRGGAAIGTSGSNAPNTSDDVIQISGNAQVEAIAGTGAEAIGAGQGQKSTNTQKVIDTDSGAQVTLTGDAPTTMKVAEGAKGSIKVPEGGAAAVLVPADESKLPVEVGAGASEQTVDLADVEYPVAVASLTRTVGGQPVVTRYASLKEAYDATVDGDTITILADFDLTEAFTLGSADRNNLIIDLNGKTMTLKTVVSTQYKNLTFENGAIDVGEPAGGQAGEHAWKKLFYAEFCELKFLNVTLTYTNGVCDVGISNGGGAKLTFKDSTLNFANCNKPISLGSTGDIVFDHTVINADKAMGHVVHGEDVCGPVIFKNGTTVTMKDCGGLSSNGTVEMSDTTVVATGLKNPFFNYSSATLVNNVNISIEGSIDAHGITGCKKLVVGSGCVLDVRNIEYLGMYIGDGSEFKSGSTVIISNCCTTANEGKPAYIGQDIAVWASGNLAIAPDADVRIYGKLVAYGGSGTISIADGRYTSLVQSAANEKFNLTGGVYKQEPAKEFIDPWYEAVPNTDAKTKAEGYAWMIAKKVPQIVTEPKDPEAIAAAAKVVDQSGNPVSKEGLSAPQKEQINTLAEKVAAVQTSTVSALTFVETEIDKSVMNPPTSPDAKPTVKPTIVAELKAKAIEQGLPEAAVNAQITTDSDVNHYIDVDITTPEMKLVDANISLKALTYDVKPMVKTVVVTQDAAGNEVSNVVERQLANSEIVRPLTFRMPLTPEFVGQNIKVTHSKDAEGLLPVEGSWRTRVYPVKGTGTDVYVEVQSDKFSFFKNELTVDQPTQVEVWTGGVWTAVSSLGDAASAASEAAAIRHEMGVIIRLVANQTEGCTLPLNVTLETNGHTIGTVTAEGGFTLTLDENGVYRCIDFGVTNVNVKQRYPWNGLVDITYTLSEGLPSGYDLIVTLTDKSNAQIKYSATTFIAPPTFNKGVNTVVWNAFADLNGLVLRNFKCTIEVKKRLN